MWVRTARQRWLWLSKKAAAASRAYAVSSRGKAVGKQGLALVAYRADAQRLSKGPFADRAPRRTGRVTCNTAGNEDRLRGALVEARLKSDKSFGQLWYMSFFALSQESMKRGESVAATPLSGKRTRSLCEANASLTFLHKTLHLGCTRLSRRRIAFNMP